MRCVREIANRFHKALWLTRTFCGSPWKVLVIVGGLQASWNVWRGRDGWVSRWLRFVGVCKQLVTSISFPMISFFLRGFLSAYAASEAICCGNSLADRREVSSRSSLSILKPSGSSTDSCGVPALRWMKNFFSLHLGISYCDSHDPRNTWDHYYIKQSDVCNTQVRFCVYICVCKSLNMCVDSDCTTGCVDRAVSQISDCWEIGLGAVVVSLRRFGENFTFLGGLWTCDGMKVAGREVCDLVLLVIMCVIVMGNLR